MPTLTINGTKVQVDDSFLTLSPEQQNATVDEIAAHLQGQQAAPKPGTPEYAAMIQARVNAGQSTPQPASAPPELQLPDVMPAPLRAFSTHAVEGIPILGGIAHNMTSSPMFDAVNAQATQQAPGAATAGDVFGAVAPFAALGATGLGARALGITSDLPGLAGFGARTAASAASNAAITGADSLTRGADLPQAARDAAMGGTIGAILPGAGDLIGKGLSAAGGAVTRGFDALTNTDRAAQRAVSGAAAADIRAGQALSPLDEANAALNGQPLANADRFGGNVRTLARTAKNTAPDAGAALDDLTQDRFLTQSPRAINFIKRITGGATDDLALQDQIATQARASNRAAYDRAYSAPGAQAVWTPEIRDLFKSPDFLSAVRGATGTGANDAAISGQRAILNPFVFHADGSVALKRLPGGGVAKPNLPFWDIVQRNLRSGSEKAFRAGDNLRGSQLAQMRTKLLGGLDTAVPEFQAARQGAAAAFGAEDALDAGRKFVSQRMGIPEAKQAYMKFTPAEKKAFGVGFASSLIDKIGSVPDRVNVINTVFGSPAARQQVELALGKNAAAQLEQFVRVEDIMQLTKQAVQGNSSTAKQLIAAGVVGGGLGGAFGGWDPRSIASGAFLLTAGRAGMRALGKSVDQKVMQRVAEILSSGNPAEINKQVLNATLSPQHALALKAIETGLNALARGASVAALRPAALN